MFVFVLTFFLDWYYIIFSLSISFYQVYVACSVCSILCLFVIYVCNSINLSPFFTCMPDQKGFEGCKSWGFTPWKYAQKVSHLWVNITGDKRAHVWINDKILLLVFFSGFVLVWHGTLCMYVYIHSFPVDDRGTIKSVVEYFQETYKFTLKQTQWPCLQVGNLQRPNYLPMEVCALLFSLVFLGWPCINLKPPWDTRFRFARL